MVHVTLHGLGVCGTSPTASMVHVTLHVLGVCGASPTASMVHVTLPVCAWALSDAGQIQLSYSVHM